MDRWFIVVIEVLGIFVGIIWIWRLYVQALEQTARVALMLRHLKQPEPCAKPRRRRKAKTEGDAS